MYWAFFLIILQKKRISFSNLALWLIFGSASQKWIAFLKNDIKQVKKIREAVFFKVNLEVLPLDKKKVLIYFIWKFFCEKRDKLMVKYSKICHILKCFLSMVWQKLDLASLSWTIWKLELDYIQMFWISKRKNIV